MMAATAADINLLHRQPSDVLGHLAAAAATKRHVLRQLQGQQQASGEEQQQQAPSPSSSMGSIASLSALPSTLTAASTPQQREEARKTAVRRHRWGLQQRAMTAWRHWLLAALHCTAPTRPE
jgi:hypothetical protein